MTSSASLLNTQFPSTYTATSVDLLACENSYAQPDVYTDSCDVTFTIPPGTPSFHGVLYGDCFVDNWSPVESDVAPGDVALTTWLPDIDNGNCRVSTPIEYNAADGVTAAFTATPASSEPGQYQFVSTSVDEAGGALTETWDFGDGAAATGSAVTHTYTTPGTYHATLTATSQAGVSATVTHDVVVAAPALTTSVSFVDAAGAPLASVSPKVGEAVHYKVTVAAGQAGVGALGHVAFVGDPLTLALGAELVTVAGPTPAVPTDFTLQPGESRSFIYDLTATGAGIVRAMTQATAVDAGGTAITSDPGQLSYSIGGLRIELTVNPPTYDADPDASGPKPVDITVTQTITNVTSDLLKDVNIRSLDVVRTKPGQLLTATPKSGPLPDPIAGEPIGDLAPGQSKTIVTVFTLKADGHVQFTSVATAASPTGGTVRGSGSTDLAIKVTKVLALTSRVLNPTGVALFPAGSAITITGTVHNLTNSAKLDVGPLFATTVGNAGLQGLAYDGVGMDPKALQLPGALTLDPGDTKTFTLKVLTAYSEPTGAGGVRRSGGTSATISFTPWATVTLDDGTSYTTKSDGSEILATPDDLSHRVSIDDSIPIPEHDGRVIAGAILVGGVEGAWNAASGMVTGLINLPNTSASTLLAVTNYQAQVWDSFTDEEKEQFSHDTGLLIAAVLLKNVEAAQKGTPALIKQMSDLSYDYMTKLENERQIGNYAQVVELYSSYSTNAYAQIAIPIAIGEILTSSRATAAIEATQAELQANAAVVVARAEGAVTVEQIAPLLVDLANGTELDAAAIERLFGITAAELAEFQRLATKYHYLLTVRARSATSINWIEEFHAAVKPEALKIKTVSPLDVRLGYPADSVGSLVFKEPEPLMAWKAAGARSGEIRGYVEAFVQSKGFTPGTNDYYSAVFRVSDRIGEWNRWESTYAQWNAQGWMDTTFSWKAQDIIPPEGSGPKYTGFQLVPTGVDNEYIVEIYNELVGAMTRVTGDIDAVAFSHLDGGELAPDEFVALLDEMRQNPLIQAQHGPAETYTEGGIEFIESQFAPGEPGLQIAPTGIAPRIVRLNSELSEWSSATRKSLVWDGGIVTTGSVPEAAPAAIDIDFAGLTKTTAAPVEALRPLPGNGAQGQNVGRCRVIYSTSPAAESLIMNAAGGIDQVVHGELSTSSFQSTCFSAGPTVDLSIKPATVTTAPVKAGAHEVPIAAPGPISAGVDSQSGFTVGQVVVIGVGTPEAETVTISGFGSIIFSEPLRFDHPAGSLIVVQSTPAAAPGAGAAAEQGQAAALAATGSSPVNALPVAVLFILAGLVVLLRRNRARLHPRPGSPIR
ncbi:PKD domain-containing protein [uncultured Microbacterium sp.]|uniref:PKD domain-containing protein n=1 Tax=uncultured Microbacterium sp. TaxID=191216 RepID=UPI0035CC091C